MAFSRGKLEYLYKTEPDSNVKERLLLLVLKVEGDEMIPARIAKDLHRSRTWASDWLARYKKEGVQGLKDRPKSGRPPKLTAELAVKVKKKLEESKQGWTTEQVNEMIVKDGGVRYHNIYIYTLLHKWGFKQKVPRKVHVNTASREEKEGFKKERRKY